MLSWKTSEGAQKELKSLRVDGNPRKQKHVANNHSPPVACQSAAGQKKIFPPFKLTHVHYPFASYVSCEGHLYKVFLVITTKTRLN